MNPGINIIRISQPSEEDLVIGLTRFANQIKDFSGFFANRLEPFLIAAMDEVFETEGEAGKAGAWEPLSEKYAKRKERQYPGRPILVAKGDLKRMMTSEAEFQSQISPQQFTVYTTKIGIFHQKGTLDGSLPARPFFSLTAEDKRSIARNFHVWAYENFISANKENFRSAAISESTIKQAARRA